MQTGDTVANGLLGCLGLNSTSWPVRPESSNTASSAGTVSAPLCRQGEASLQAQAVPLCCLLPAGHTCACCW